MTPLMLHNLRYAVLHHAAAEWDQYDAVEDVVDTVREWHLNREPDPFNDIGYHLVTKDHFIGFGRPLPYQGAHCFGFNDVSIGIMVAADLSKRTPTDGEVDAVVRAVAIAEAYVGRELHVVGHRDLANTLCPGPDLVRLVNAKRAFLDDELPV